MAESEPSSKEPSEIECYIHAVSPIKQSGTTKYFNCDIQTESNVVKGVCFAVEKKENLDTLAQQHSPVKIRKYTLSNKFGREDVVLSRNTSITPTTATFEYKSLHNVSSIPSLIQVAPEQLVAIKGHVSQLSGIKTVVLQSKQVKKQECFISDPTGYIKLVVWGSHTGTLQEGATYFFDKVRVKVYHQERYLNTPKNEDVCKISLVDQFADPVQVVENVSPVNELAAKILGITNMNKYYCCCSCYKKVTVKGKIASCNNCSMTMKMTQCGLQRYLKLYVQDAKKSDHKIKLCVYNDVFNKLIGICGLNESTPDDQIVESILDLELVMLSYDTQSNKVIDIDIVIKQ